MSRDSRLDAAVARVRAVFDRPFDAAVVLGSGMSDAVGLSSRQAEFAYADLDGFPAAGVTGHAGRLVIGEAAGRVVAAFCGRFHYYEGHGGDVVALPVRLAAALGARTVVFTTAVGGLNPAIRAGDAILIADHINMMGRNPLCDWMAAGRWGAADDPSPFVDMGAVYDVSDFERMAAAASRVGAALHRGVLAAVLGPSYETEAEKRMLRVLGADAVCMSTVPEAIAARALGLRIRGLALVTNAVARDGDAALSHDEVLAVARSRLPLMGELIALCLETA